MLDKDKLNKASVVVNLAVRATLALGFLVIARKIKISINTALHRTEFEPSANGTLIATEYRGDRQHKVRYATKEEVLKYSLEHMNEHLWLIIPQEGK